MHRVPQDNWNKTNFQIKERNSLPKKHVYTDPDYGLGAQMFTQSAGDFTTNKRGVFSSVA